MSDVKSSSDFQLHLSLLSATYSVSRAGSTTCNNFLQQVSKDSDTINILGLKVIQASSSEIHAIPFQGYHSWTSLTHSWTLCLFLGTKANSITCFFYPYLWSPNHMSETVHLVLAGTRTFNYIFTSILHFPALAWLSRNLLCRSD